VLLLLINVGRVGVGVHHQDREYKTLGQARALAPNINWAAEPMPVAPAMPGITVLDDIAISDLIPYIDWRYFFDVRAPLPSTAACPVLTRVAPVSVCVVSSRVWGLATQVWKLFGKYPNRKYPKIFNDDTVGPAAKKLFDEAQEMLARAQEENWLTARAVVGMYVSYD